MLTMDAANGSKVYSDEIIPSIEDIIQSNVSRNVRDFRSFISAGNFVTEKNDQNTNIICVSERKTFNIPGPNLPEFFGHLEACRRDGINIHWSERQETLTQTHSGIMIDFDRYQNTNLPQITEDHFGELITSIASMLYEFLDLSEHAEGGKLSYHIFVTRKPAIVPVELTPGQGVETTGTQVYKDGFHILIPEIQTTKALKKYILNELINRGEITAIFDNIDHMEPANKMLDKMSASVPVYFFGCSKIGRPAYKLVYGERICVTTRNGNTIREKIDIEQLCKGKVIVKGVEQDINLLYELSLHTAAMPSWLKKAPYRYRAALETKINAIAEKLSGDILSDDEIRRDNEDISLVALNNPHAKYVMSLLRLMDISFATEYPKWFTTICAIAHCGNSEDYKAVAREFSRRNPTSWSNSEFERVWSEANNKKYCGTPVTIGYIKHWANECSPAAYAELRKDHYCNILCRVVYENEGRVGHSHVANILHVTCDGKFVCDVGASALHRGVVYCWYEFVTDGQSMKKGEIYKYRQEFQPDNVHLFISDHLPKIYSQVMTNIKNRKDKATTEAETKYWAMVEKNFRASKFNLSDDTYQRKVVNQCQFRFRQRGFYDELDKYTDVIGVGNGVLKGWIEPQLITGHHEYKISKYTEVDYRPFNPNCPKTQLLLQAYRDIFIEPDVFHFMMLHASTGLDLNESACILVIIVGGGQNGKTFFLKMTHNTLGNMYCSSGKASLITGPMENSNNANSAQMQQKDKRYYYIDEFDNNSTLNSLRVKAMVTPGWQSGRDNYKDQQNFKNTSNTILASNFDFHMETNDHGTWRRVYYYTAKKKFTDDPDPENPFEQKCNPDLMDKITNDPEYLSADLSIKTYYRGILDRDYGGDLKRVPVPTILRETEAFRNRADSINRFLTAMLCKSPGAEPIGLSSLANRYIQWYAGNVKSNANLTAKDVISQFTNSRIAKWISRKSEDVLFLNEHRLLNMPEEELNAGEEHLGARALSVGSVGSVNANVPISSYTEFDEDDINDIDFNSEIGFGLNKRAPVYTQKTAPTDTIESIMGDILGDL